MVRRAYGSNLSLSPYALPSTYHLDQASGVVRYRDGFLFQLRCKEKQTGQPPSFARAGLAESVTEGASTRRLKSAWPGSMCPGTSFIRLKPQGFRHKQVDTLGSHTYRSVDHGKTAQPFRVHYAPASFAGSAQELC